MSVTKRMVKGRKVWVVDHIFVDPACNEHRYRRVAKVQSARGAAAEEQAVVAHWNLLGRLPDKTPAEPAPTPKIESRSKEHTLADAVDIFRKDYLPSLKPSTRRSYGAMLDGPWIQQILSWKLAEINSRQIRSWDQKLSDGGQAESTRRNHQIVLRRILKSVAPNEEEAGLLLDKLPAFPRLPTVGRTSVEATSPEEVELLLANTKGGLRVAIALAALAGLRSGEVRALTRGDVDLSQDPAQITVSKSTATGIVTRTKSGHDREVPVSARLLTILEPHIKNLKTTALVSVNSAKNEWGDVGLSVAYSRVAKRLGIKSSKYHALRHHFATQLFVKCNAPATTVQHLLGHENLSVTQRYAHHDKKKAAEAVALL